MREIKVAATQMECTWNRRETLERADRHTPGVITAEFDLDVLADERREWGIFRDRRPELYQILMTHGA